MHPDKVPKDNVMNRIKTERCEVLDVCVPVFDGGGAFRRERRIRITINQTHGHQWRQEIPWTKQNWWKVRRVCERIKENAKDKAPKRAPNPRPRIGRRQRRWWQLWR